MKIRYALLAAALALALTGCQAEEPTGTAPVPPEPSPAAGVPLRTPPELPSPEELLERQPMDDTHDAFLVDTGGKLGTLLVTAELGERGPNPDLEWEPWENPVYLSVWDPGDMGEPIQRMDAVADGLMFGEHEVVDANFDGYMDFSVLRSMGNAAGYWYLWVWDEGAGQFVEVPEYREISLPRRSPETEIIDGWARNSGAGDGVTTFHRWEDGRLVCVRRIELFAKDYSDYDSPFVLTVRDRINDELTEVFREEYPLDPEEEYFEARMKWEDINYHGETR